MEIHIMVGLVLSAVIGITLGLIGGGGSIIAISILIYIIGIKTHQAIVMSLAVVGVVSLIGAGLHNQRGSVKLRAGILFSGVGMVGAYLGSHVTHQLSSIALLLSFSSLKMVIGVLLLMKRYTNQNTIALQSRSKLKEVLTSLIIGFLTGFLGVGGGLTIMPALMIFHGLSSKDAIGTSLLIVTAHCGAGMLGHLHYGNIDFRMLMLMTVIAIDGTLIGTALSYRASLASLKKWFVIFVIAVALFITVKNYIALYKQLSN